jgi:hypothetical protein
MPRNAIMNLKSKYFLSETLSQTFNKHCSALAGAAITVLAIVEPFIASGAAVGLFAIVYCFLKVLMVWSYPAFTLVGIYTKNLCFSRSYSLGPSVFCL